MIILLSQGINHLCEGQVAHFEAQIEPIHDPDLKVEFFHNGKPINQGSRIHTLCDFGYVALDISHLVMVDEGEYICKVSNKHGEAQSKISLKLSGKDTLDTSSQRPEGLEKIQRLEMRQQRATNEEIKTFQAPVFTTGLQNVEKEEGQNIHLSARLIPVGDPAMVVEWFKDGKALSSGSRINYVNDFGCVMLDISNLRSDDQGYYECKAKNLLGEAVTTSTIKVAAKGSLILDSQHPEGMKKITALEMNKVRRQVSEGGQQFERPVFTHPLSGTSQVAEGENVHLECRVVPVGDSNMKYDWYCNGSQLKLGSRYHVTQDFGFVTLDISSCNASDSGMYMVKAVNLSGEATSSLAVHVGGSGAGVLEDTLHADSYKKIQALEAQKMKKRESQLEAGEINQPPVFMEQLKNVGTVSEGQNIHVEATVEPKNDPNLKVEWELNGKSVSSGKSKQFLSSCLSPKPAMLDVCTVIDHVLVRLPNI